MKRAVNTAARSRQGVGRRRRITSAWSSAATRPVPLSLLPQHVAQQHLPLTLTRRRTWTASFQDYRHLSISNVSPTTTSLIHFKSPMIPSMSAIPTVSMFSTRQQQQESNDFTAAMIRSQLLQTLLSSQKLLPNGYSPMTDSSVVSVSETTIFRADTSGPPIPSSIGSRTVSSSAVSKRKIDPPGQQPLPPTRSSMATTQTTFSTSATAAAETVEEESVDEPFVDDENNNGMKDVTADEISPPPKTLSKEEKALKRHEKSAKRNRDKKIKRRQKRLLRDHVSSMRRLLRMDDISSAAKLFQSMERDGIADDLRPDLVRKIFYTVNDKLPTVGYQILLHYQKLTKLDLNEYTSMYRRCCAAIRNMKLWGPNETKRAKSAYVSQAKLRARRKADEKTVYAIISDIKKLNREGIEHCLPRLVSSLAQQGYPNLGLLAGEGYSYMMRNGYGANLSWSNFEDLLRQSRYYRQADLPYADILRHAVVDRGFRPSTEAVLLVLENLFPYYNHLQSTQTALQAILELRSQTQPNDKEQYQVDMAALEAIGAVAVRVENVDLALLVWNLVESMNVSCPPTEAIYENAAAAFAVHTSTYGHVFVVLSEMQARGFTPSRALIRSVSRRFRESNHLINVALGQLKSLDEKGIRVTTAALNTILAAGAERGNADRLFNVLDEFEIYDCQPDADTFGFAIETLGKRIGRYRRNNTEQSIMLPMLEQADKIMSVMEESGIAPTTHIVREYVQLLLHANDVETATAVVQDMLASGGYVDNKTLHIVAMANVERKNLEIARELVMSSGGREKLPFVTKAIKDAEQERNRDRTESEE